MKSIGIALGSLSLSLFLGCAHPLKTDPRVVTERDTAALSVSLRILRAQDAHEWLVSEEDLLHNGDFVSFTVRANQQAYLYVVLVGTDKSTRTLFPTPQYQLAPAHCTLRVPSHALNLGAPAGTEDLRVVVSLRPLQEVDRSLYEELELNRNPATTVTPPVVAPCSAEPADSQALRGRVPAVKTGHAESNGVAQTRFSLRHDG